MSKIIRFVVRKITKVFLLLKSLKLYFWFSENSDKTKLKKNVIYLDIVDPELYQRYFYIFCKYFLILKYEVYLKKSFKSIYYMLSDVDTSFLFHEHGFFLGKPLKERILIQLSNSILNPNYFDFLRNSFGSPKSYHVPIGFHPYIYHKEYWANKIQTNHRFKSLFMAGNFSKVYSNDYNAIFFGVINRNEVKENVEKLGLLTEVISMNIDHFVKSLKDSSVYIIDRKEGVPIHPKEIFELLSRFEFFFALPGLYMPMCHNIVEAMAVGTIPFLQDGYAKSLQPNLTNGINCVTFDKLENLKERIDYIFSMDQESIARLRVGVLTYFRENLSAETVVSNILSGEHSQIYLMAEKYSVDQFAVKFEE